MKASLFLYSLVLQSTAVIAQQAAVQTAPQPKPDSSYILQKADRDGKGVISPDEVTYLRGSGDGRGAWQILNQHFSEMDANSDGSLSQQEIDQGFNRSDIETLAVHLDYALQLDSRHCR